MENLTQKFKTKAVNLITLKNSLEKTNKANSFMAPVVIDHEKFTFKVHVERDFLEYFVKPDVTIDAFDVIEGKKIITNRWPKIKFFVYAEGLNFFTLTKGAREISASKAFSDNTKAVAFYTTNASLILLGKMYLKIDKPFVPTKIFSDKNEALHWLEVQMKKDKHK